VRDIDKPDQSLDADGGPDRGIDSRSSRRPPSGTVASLDEYGRIPLNIVGEFRAIV
jgi:hypothetical protein